uniref:Uncharacterized protein n=1 Tax=Timema tahoe TaxID=61484 RepID=A0A7R9NZ58_9NEOP|nr:unnamed protein product [Timema tahoe]
MIGMNVLVLVSAVACAMGASPTDVVYIYPGDPRVVDNIIAQPGEIPYIVSIQTLKNKRLDRNSKLKCEAGVGRNGSEGTRAVRLLCRVAPPFSFTGLCAGCVVLLVATFTFTVLCAGCVVLLVATIHIHSTVRWLCRAASSSIHIHRTVRRLCRAASCYHSHSQDCAPAVSCC